MKNKGIEYDDLFSQGCIGLVKAAKRFDESKGFQFSTYAVPLILGEIKQLFRDNNPIKISRSLKTLSMNIKNEIEKQKKENNKEPTINEIAEKLNVTPEEVVEALNASMQIKSLDSEVGINQKVFCEIEEKTINRVDVLQAIEKLELIDKQIILLRFFKDKTQIETAKILGLSQVQISRKEKTLLNLLKSRLIYWHFAQIY